MRALVGAHYFACLLHWFDCFFDEGDSFFGQAIFVIELPTDFCNNSISTSTSKHPMRMPHEHFALVLRVD